MELDKMAEKMVQFRHECLSKKVDFSEVMTLSWHWWNDDMIESLSRTCEGKAKEAEQ